MAEKLSAVFSAISLGQISKIKQISYTENGQSLDTKKPLTLKQGAHNKSGVLKGGSPPLQFGNGRITV